MSAWQRWQASDFMKYLEGMLPLCLVCAELGKNFPCGPSPSPSMEAAGICGFTMRLAFLHGTSRDHQAPAEMTAVARTSPANRKTRCAAVVPSKPCEASHAVAANREPMTQRAIC